METTTSKEDIIDYVFPSHIPSEPTSCLTRSILAPTNRQIDNYDKIILQRIPGEITSYIATDTLKEANDNDLRSPSSILDFVARHPPPGLPMFNLEVKKNGVYRLL